jgi:hypothetical protein
VLHRPCIEAHARRARIPQLGEIAWKKSGRGAKCVEQADKFGLAVGAGFGKDGFELAAQGVVGTIPALRAGLERGARLSPGGL